MSAYVKVVPSLSYEDFFTVLGLNAVIGTVCFVIFWIARSVKKNKYFYAPLYYKSYVLCFAWWLYLRLTSNRNAEHDCEYTENPMPPHKPDVPDPGRGLFSWATATLGYHDENLLATRGLDALMHLRTMRLMLFILCSYCIVALGLLLLNLYPPHSITIQASWYPWTNPLIGILCTTSQLTKLNASNHIIVLFRM